MKGDEGDQDRWRVLFVCGRNQWRSPTGQNIYQNDQRMQVRSAGLSPSSRCKLGSADVEWADVIFAMEPEQVKQIREKYRENLNDTQLMCLDIPDDYRYMDEELVELIRAGVESWWEQ